MSRTIILITILFSIKVIHSQNYVGSSCRLPHNGEYGECTYSNYCPAVQQLQSRGLQVSICSQFYGTYVVCCPIQRGSFQTSSQWSFPNFQKQSVISNYPQVQPVMQDYSQIIQTTPSTLRPASPTRAPASPTRAPAFRASTRAPRVLWPGSSTLSPSGRTFNLKPARISEQKCKEFKSIGAQEISVSSLSLNPSVRNVTVDNCDVAQGLIVGGKKAKPNEFPHMAAIGWRLTGGSIVFKCGGSLISERFVLTVAHCSFDMQSELPPSFVRLGQNNLSRTNGVDLNIAEFIKHKSYDSLSRYFDIAVIKLSRNVAFSNAIRPACLWQTLELSHSKAIATGWGALKTNGETTDVLMKVEINIKGNDECDRKFANDDTLENGVTSDFICAGSDKGKDTCQGDSGGPLQIVKTGAKCQFHIIGLTAFAPYLCASRAAVAGYTRVSHYIDWIEDKVWR